MVAQKMTAQYTPTPAPTEATIGFPSRVARNKREIKTLPSSVLSALHIKAHQISLVS